MALLTLHRNNHFFPPRTVSRIPGDEYDSRRSERHRSKRTAVWKSLPRQPWEAGVIHAYSGDDVPRYIGLQLFTACLHSKDTLSGMEAKMFIT